MSTVKSFGPIQLPLESETPFYQVPVRETRVEKLTRVLGLLQTPQGTLTSNQINQLAQITTFTGKYAYAENSIEGNNFIAEVSNLLHLYGFEQAYPLIVNYYSQAEDISMFNPEIESYRRRVIDRNRAEETDEALEDVGICRTCGHDKIRITSAQTRGLDEETGTIYTCGNCNSRDVKLYNINSR